MALMRIGILTGGGDCPGLNAVIRAVWRSADCAGDVLVGIRDGWGGLLDDNLFELTDRHVSGILPRGGTVLGTSRRSVLEHVGEVTATVARHELDGIIAVGGNGTLFAAHALSAHLPVVGVPKTIDNDLSGTDRTIGFDTAVQVATEAIDRLHTTAESHYRDLVVEVMGRNAGWIALHAGLAGGAHVILSPERAFDLDDVAARLLRRRGRGKRFSIVVVAEGAMPQDGVLSTRGQHDALGRARIGGIGHLLEAELEARTGAETRAVVLGHIQRGGTPSAYDRILATRMGARAHRAVTEGDFGTMAALRADDVLLVSLEEASSTLKLVPASEFEAAAALLA